MMIKRISLLAVLLLLASAAAFAGLTTQDQQQKRPPTPTFLASPTTLPPAPHGKIWVRAASFEIPAGEAGRRSMPGQESRFSHNASPKWPFPAGSTTVVYLVEGLSAEQAADYGGFTVMEDKPAGCDSGRDQPRGPVKNLGEPIIVGGLRCENGNHYLGRKNGPGLPAEAHTIVAYALQGN